MPVKSPPRPHYTKRKPTKHFMKVYWPYLPLAISVGLSLLVGFYFKPQLNPGSTLAYATDMSLSGLLEATNQERAKNGKGALKLSEQLNKAAQAKANDMAQSNYWAHVSPDGKQPWYFIDLSGYTYQKAGENLAYGFDNYRSAISGWMNSPSHRDNLLDEAFYDVGFGVANIENYQRHGNQTVVVAHYGRALGDTASSLNLANLSSGNDQADSNPLQVDTLSPLTSTDGQAAGGEQKISLAQAIGKGKINWANSFLLGSVIGGLAVVLLLKHGLALRRAFGRSERFILHHPLLDATIVSFIVLGILLAQDIGVIL